MCTDNVDKKKQRISQNQSTSFKDYDMPQIEGYMDQVK